MNFHDLKPIPGADGYYADAEGAIWSVKRLKSVRDKNGRCVVGSTRCKHERYVHRLVALAFHGRPPRGKTAVRHLDGNPANNRPGNLRWSTAREVRRSRKRGSP